MPMGLLTAMSAGALAHLVAALAFSFLALLLVVGWGRGRRDPWLLIACILTALWALAVALDGPGAPFMGAVLALDICRGLGWVLYLISVVAPMWSRAQRRLALILLPGTTGFVVALVLAYELYVRAGAPSGIDGGLLSGAGHMARVVIAIVGLLLIENLYRNTRTDYRWAVKFVCIGLGGLFAYDFFMYSDALLFKQLDSNLVEAHGLVAAAVVPLLVMFLRGDPDKSLQLYVSRKTVFHTATFIGAGLYLLLMWAVAVYLREFGGRWGALFHVVFLFAAFLMLTVVMFSGAFRAWLRTVISKHFFHYRYDYREEWLRLIDVMSSDGGSLAENVVRAFADIVESPEGVLWLYEDGVLAPAGSWQIRMPDTPVPADPDLICFFETRKWVIDLDELAEKPDFYGGLTVPDGLRETRRPWLLAPLIHHGLLLGLVCLHQSRAPRRLDWEDYDLLKTLGRQTAHYLAEQRTGRALAESRQFEQFNKRFAFVLHDIKNLVSQLTLLLSNAEKHRDNPEFQQDMVETIQESVTKMNHLLDRLHRGGKDVAAASAIDLQAFLESAIARETWRPGSIELQVLATGVAVLADEERLSAVVAHILENALDAAGEDGLVRVMLLPDDGEAVIEIEDNGPGMDQAFIREKLFRPFQTTKQGGYGIGAFESREYLRELGGRIDVSSAPGKGTLVRIHLPVIEPSNEPPGEPPFEPSLGGRRRKGAAVGGSGGGAGGDAE